MINITKSLSIHKNIKLTNDIHWKIYRLILNIEHILRNSHYLILDNGQKMMTQCHISISQNGNCLSFWFNFWNMIHCAESYQILNWNVLNSSPSIRCIAITILCLEIAFVVKHEEIEYTTSTILKRIIVKWTLIDMNFVI